MSRDALQQAVVWTASLLVAVATVTVMAGRGEALVRRPATFVDHVSEAPPAIRSVILLMPQVEPLIPEGASVTAFRPQNGRAHNDHDTYLAAVGLLPRHFVIPPFSAFDDTQLKDLAEWVVAVEAPFDHPHYRAVAGFPQGWLYRVDR